MAKLVSKVYGDALFETAMEQGQIDAFFEEVSALLPILEEHQDLIRLLNNPRIGKDEKITMMDQLFGGKVLPELMGFLTIIVDKDRQNDMIAIFEYFVSIVKEYKKIGTATVTSAEELRGEQRAELEKRLLETTGYVSFETKYEVDPSLIGGLVIRIGDRVVDSSIKTQLYEMKRELSKLQLA